MSKLTKLAVAVAAIAPATAASTSTAELKGLGVQISGIAGGCVLAIEGTLDGSRWVRLCNLADGAAVNNVGSTFSADGIYRLGMAKLDPEEQVIWAVRVNRTVLGTGTPVVTVFGRDERCD